MHARKIIRLTSTPSTNSAAIEAGEQGAAPGTVVVAASQSAGRGRLNRSWLSPPGMGLYFSLLLRPQLAVEDLSKVTLASGLAVCLAVEAEYAVRPLIKWPNDLLLAGKKFCGILTETGSMQHLAGARQPLVVVGIGLNLFSPEHGFPAVLQERATALAEHTDRKIDAESLLQKCVSSIEQAVARLEKGDFPAILAEWRQRDAIGDKVLTWVTPKGKEVTGVSLGPDTDGMLRIRDRDGAIHTVLSGDVNLAGNDAGLV